MASGATSIGTNQERNDSDGQVRAIEGIYAPPAFHWVGDGFRVAGYFSAIPNAAKKLSPFLMMDYHPSYSYAPTETERRGVGPHPHRGFETVTLAFQGSVAHHDSMGNGGVIGPGDVQWMTAASGILHQEYHGEDYARVGGPFQMIQLWVNLPKAHKMSAPRYQALLSKQMGQATLANNAGLVRVIAGEYLGTKGLANTFTKVNLLDVMLNAGGMADFSFPARDNAALLVMAGDVRIGDRMASANDFVLFANVGERFAIEATSEAHIVVLSGEPIDEAIVQHGPFVMTTEREIHEAIDDFRQGKFGTMSR